MAAVRPQPFSNVSRRRSVARICNLRSNGTTGFHPVDRLQAPPQDGQAGRAGTTSVPAIRPDGAYFSTLTPTTGLP